MHNYELYVYYDRERFRYCRLSYRFVEYKSFIPHNYSRLRGSQDWQKSCDNGKRKVLGTSRITAIIWENEGFGSHL